MAKKELYFGLTKTKGFLISKNLPVSVTIPADISNLKPSNIARSLNGNTVYFSNLNGKTSGIGKPVNEINTELSLSNFKDMYNQGKLIGKGKKFIKTDGSLGTGILMMTPTSRQDIGENDIINDSSKSFSKLDSNETFKGTISNTYSYSRMPSGVARDTIDILAGYTGFNIEKNNSGRFIGIARYKDFVTKLVNTDDSISITSYILNKRYLLLDTNSESLGIKGSIPVTSDFLSSNIPIIASKGSNYSVRIKLLNGSYVTYSNSIDNNGLVRLKNTSSENPLEYILPEYIPEALIVKHYIKNLFVIENVTLQLDMSIKALTIPKVGKGTFYTGCYTHVKITFRIPESNYNDSYWFYNLINNNTILGKNVDLVINNDSEIDLSFSTLPTVACPAPIILNIKHEKIIDALLSGKFTLNKYTVSKKNYIALEGSILTDQSVASEDSPITVAVSKASTIGSYVIGDSVLCYTVDGCSLLFYDFHDGEDDNIWA